MRFRRWFSALPGFLFPILVLAQSPDAESVTKERQQKLAAVIEQSLADIQAIRLPENRAIFYCQVANIVWPQDPNRARVLFQTAANELISAQNLAESKRSLNPNNELLTGGSTRQQLLNMIASRNAELALELLVDTRPIAVQKALSADNQENNKVSNYPRGNNYLVQNEKNLEQNFYRMAAEQSPERAAKILAVALSKGLSNDTFYQLTRLAEKDQQAATALGSQVVDKLLRLPYLTDGQPQYINIQLTQSILSHQMSKQSGSDSNLKFHDSQIQNLAGKFVSAYLSDQRIAPYIGTSVVTIAERFSPATVQQVKRVANRTNPQNVPTDLDAIYQKLMEADTPAEQMMASAGRFSIDQRRQIYQTASNKFIAQGDSQAARAVLDENFTDEAREQALNNFDQQYAYNLIGQNKFTEAEQVIDRLPEQQRVSALVNLATSVFSRDQKENKSYALALLAKAGQLTAEKPENSVEMNMLTQVIAGYNNIEPAEAIRIFEGLVPKINELADAAVVLHGFQNGSNVREGEFIMTNGDPFSNYGVQSSMLGGFAKFDFDRTMRLIDGFTRQEMRISLRLQVAASGDIITASLPFRRRRNDGFIIVSGGRDK